MSRPRRTILITGGAGFLGHHLARRLIDGGLTVVLFDRSFDDRSCSTPDLEAPALVRVRGDVTDMDAIGQAIQAQRVDLVVHLATLLTEACASDPVRAAHVNCVGTAGVFATAARHAVRRVIFGSSVAVFGRADEVPTGDARPPAPVSVYGATKAFAEHLAGAMMRDHLALDLVGLRFGWIYGPGRVRGWNEIQRVVEGFALEREVVCYPAYEEPNDWTHVDDAVEAIVRCMDAPRPSVVAYNVRGDYRPIADAVSHLQRRFPHVRAEPVPATLPPVAWDFASERITAEVGYTLRITLEQGLDRTVDEIRRLASLPPVAPWLPRGTG